MAEGLEAAVGVDRQLAVEVEHAGFGVLPRLAPSREAEVLHQDQLGRREAVVDLGHGQLTARVGDAGLGVRVLGGPLALVEVRVVVVRVQQAGRVAGDEAQRLHVERLVGVVVRVLGAHDDGARRAVGDAGAVEHRQHPRDGGHGADGVDVHLAAELRPRVLGAVGVVLAGDAGQHPTQLGRIDAVLLGVGGGDEREHGRRGEGPVGAVVGDGERVEALVARVLDLLDADRGGHVVGARRHRVAGLAQRLGPGGAVVLDPGDRLALQLQRGRQRHARHAGLGGSEPPGVDVVDADARGVEPGVGPLDRQVVESLVPVLAERGAPHADDGDAVLDAVAGHVRPLPRSVRRPGPMRPGGPSRSSWRSRPRC